MYILCKWWTYITGMSALVGMYTYMLPSREHTMSVQIIKSACVMKCQCMIRHLEYLHNYIYKWMLEIYNYIQSYTYVPWDWLTWSCETIVHYMALWENQNLAWKVDLRNPSLNSPMPIRSTTEGHTYLYISSRWPPVKVRPLGTDFTGHSGICTGVCWSLQQKTLTNKSRHINIVREMLA